MTHKEDLDPSPVELTLGNTLTLPGELLPTNTPSEDSVARTEVLRNLCHDVALMCPTPGMDHAKHAVRIPVTLKDATDVYVWRDRHRGPIDPAYNGPYQVVEHRDKTSYRHPWLQP